MSVDYTYIRVPKEFSEEAVEGATGVKISAILTIPQIAIVFTVHEALSPEQLQPLDFYMNDFGYQRSTQ